MVKIELESDGLRLLLPLLRRASTEEADAMAELRGEDSDKIYYPPYLDHLTRKWHYDSMLHQLEHAAWLDTISVRKEDE